MKSKFSPGFIKNFKTNDNNFSNYTDDLLLKDEKIVVLRCQYDFLPISKIADIYQNIFLKAFNFFAQI